MVMASVCRNRARVIWENQGGLPGLGDNTVWAVLRRNFLAPSVCCNPPGVCLWSPDQISKHVRGVRAVVAASSVLPYCWPSSSKHQVNLLDPVRHWAVCRILWARTFALCGDYDWFLILVCPQSAKQRWLKTLCGRHNKQCISAKSDRNYNWELVGASVNLTELACLFSAMPRANEHQRLGVMDCST